MRNILNNNHIYVSKNGKEITIGIKQIFIGTAVELKQFSTNFNQIATELHKISKQNENATVIY